MLQIHEDSAEDKLLKAQTYTDLRQMIHLLPDEQKEVLIMRHYADLSFKEIADLTDVSINTALGRMRYALSNLRRMMKVKEVS
ncbi:RNA polymerase sigma factor [compost metagenome]